MSTNLPLSEIARPAGLQRWLKLDSTKKPALYAELYAAAEMSSLSYWLEIIFSAGIAALGLVLNSPAVVIGAMLISPLMGPIMATGLALAAGDLYLSLKAIANLVASIALAIGLSAFIVWLLPFHSVTEQILSRTNPDLLDLCVALFSGLAGSVAVCRAGTGGAVTTLPGVAIAVALMPPLCTMGYGLGSGANMRIMGGAGLLFLTNVVAIVSSAFVVFLLVGMNSPEVRTAIAQSRESDRFAEKVFRTRFGSMLAIGGQLRWRVLMLAILLAAIAVPLRTALVQVAGETLVRGAVQDVVKHLLPQGALVSQQAQVGRGNVTIQLISTQSIPDAKVRSAEEEIERRSGRKATISVSTVASQGELEELMAHLAAPPPPMPKPVVESLPEIDQKLIVRVTPVIDSVWPSEAPLQDFDLAFGATGIVLNVRYQGTQNLGTIPLEMITKECQEKLDAPGLTVNAQRVAPPRAATHIPAKRR